MTNYNERLDEVLFNLTDQSAWDLIGITQEQANELSSQLDRDRAEAKQAITSLTNSQIETVLDRLESQLQDPNNVDFYDEDSNSLMSLGEWLLLERNKLKGSRNDQL